MGYNYATGHCDERCMGCTLATCIDNPRRNEKTRRGARLKVNAYGELPERRCAHCGEMFAQEEPYQRFCSASCREEHDDATVSALTWVRRRGYRGKADFVKDWGLREWLAIGGA